MSTSNTGASAMHTPRLILKRFPVDLMKTDTFVVLLARRGSGKSSLEEDLARHLNGRVNKFIAFGGSLGAVRQFRQYVPELYIYERWDPAVMQKVIDTQTELKEAKDASPAAKQDIAVAVLIDDISFNRSMLNSEIMRNIAMNGRHVELMVILALHYVVDLPPPIRSQIDYLFILQEPSRSIRDKIYKLLGGACESFSMFNEIMMAATNNFGALVMDFKSRSNNIQESMFWHRGRVDWPSRMVGSREYRKLSKLHMQASRMLEEREGMCEDGFDAAGAAMANEPAVQLDGEHGLNAGPEGVPGLA
jgi:hypothetical protein